MFTLSDIPQGVFHAFIIIGLFGLIASFFVKFIPFIYRYLIPLQILSVFILVVGIYYSGVTANEAKWKARVEKLEADVKVAEEKARTTAAKVEYVFVDRVQKVKEVQFLIQERLKEIAVSIDSQCRITPDSISIVNDAAKNIKPEAKK